MELAVLGTVPANAWLTDPQRFRRYFFDTPRRRIKQLANVYNRVPALVA